MDTLSLIVGGMIGGLISFTLAGMMLVCSSRVDDAKMLAEAMSLLDDCKGCGWGSDTWQKGVKSIIKKYYQEAG